MKYGSVCSGIEAASVAWEPLGWEPSWFAEIDKFPSAVLKHHYPKVKNYGDFTLIPAGAGSIDVLVGGTPCQDFSVAGLRAGLAGERGNLTLEFLKLADRVRARWLVWENVPGVLSIDDGRTFGTFLGGLGELGYGFAYRVLDAQYFGVPQRRRRVFVIGYLGDWRPAAAVLFERESLSGYPPPSRKTRKDVTGTFTARTRSGAGFGTDFECDGGIVAGSHDLAPALMASGRGTDRAGDSRGQDAVVAMCLNAGGNMRLDAESETLVAATLDASYGRLQGASGQDLNHNHSHLVTHALDTATGCTEDGTERGVPLVSHGLTQRYDSSEDGCGRGVRLIAAFNSTGNGWWNDSEVAAVVRCGGERDSTLVGVPQSFSENVRGEVRTSEVMSALSNGGGKPGQGYPAIFSWNGDETPKCSEDVALTMRADQGGEGYGIAEVLPTMQCGSGLEAGHGARNGDTKDAYITPAVYPTLSANEGGTLTQIPPVECRQGVRRLTPRECERLQGFPDDWTLVPHRGKAAADGPRYKALGNSMAVPVMRWIGERIQAVSDLVDSKQRGIA